MSVLSSLEPNDYGWAIRTASGFVVYLHFHTHSMRAFRRGRGPRTPTSLLESHNVVWLLSNTRPSQGYPTSIQCSAIIDPPAKGHLNVEQQMLRWDFANAQTRRSLLCSKYKKYGWGLRINPIFMHLAPLKTSAWMFIGGCKYINVMNWHISHTQV